MNEVTKVETSEDIIMDVSIHSMIAQRINFLAMAIRDENESDNAQLYIECFTRNQEEDGEMKDVQIIRFSTDLTLWTEIHPINKFKSPILQRSVSVNLFDLYNVLKCCNTEQSDIIAFRIDNEGKNLLVSTLYNDIREYYEVEVSLKINNIDFPRIQFVEIENKEPDAVIELDALTIRYILVMNAEQKTDGVNIVIKNNKLSFQTDYNGFRTNTVVKLLKDRLFEKDVSVFVPFYILNLMAGTGEVKPIKFNIFEDKIIIDAAEYHFGYKIEEKREPFEISSEGTEELCVVDPSNMEPILDLMINLNKSSKTSVVEISKLEDLIGELQMVNEDRYKISTIMECIMSSETPIKADAKILQWMVVNASVDAVKFQYYPEKLNDVYLKYENALLIKEMHYDHDRFMAYRDDEIKKLEA